MEDEMTATEVQPLVRALRELVPERSVPDEDVRVRQVLDQLESRLKWGDQRHAEEFRTEAMEAIAALLAEREAAARAEAYAERDAWWEEHARTLVESAYQEGQP